MSNAEDESIVHVGDKALDLRSIEKDNLVMKAILLFCLSCFLLSGCAARMASVDSVQAASFSTDKELGEIAIEAGLSLRRLDVNRDERPDVYKFFQIVYADDGTLLSEYLARKDIDINYDGRIDVIRLFGADKVMTEESLDLDFDGLVDTRSYFRDGKLSRKEVDIDYDGIADVVKKYEDGQLKVIESDKSGDGKIDTWEYFEEGALDRIGRDTDADGKVDYWERANPALEEDEAAEEVEEVEEVEEEEFDDSTAEAEE